MMVVVSPAVTGTGVPLVTEQLPLTQGMSSNNSSSNPEPSGARVRTKYDPLCSPGELKVLCPEAVASSLPELS